MAQDTEFEVGMKIGDLAHPVQRMVDMGYPCVGIIIGIKGGRDHVSFHNGTTAFFHPRWIKNEYYRT